MSETKQPTIRTETIANEIIQSLFVNGFGERAVRLQLRDMTERDLGGLHELVVRKRVIDVLQKYLERGRA